MSDTTFGAILDTPSTAVERPKPLPAGTYHCVVDKQYKEGTTTRKGTEFIEFSLKPMSALDDVNEEDLKASLTSADGSVKPLSDKRIRATYYLTPDSIYRLNDFLINDLGIVQGKKKLRQMIGEAQNRQVLAHIKLVPSDDGTMLYANMDKTAPVAE